MHSWPTSDAQAYAVSNASAPKAETPSTGSALQTKGDETRLLRLAATLLARSQRLESRMAAVEKAFQTCKCAKVVADSGVDMLETAKVLLFKMRDISDPRARLVLVKSFNAVLRQLDEIAAEGNYDDKNLAKGEAVSIETGDSRQSGLQIAGIDMSSRGLQLRPFEGETVSNADIVDRLTKVEQASSTLVAHSLSYDTIVLLLQSRTKFARGMIEIFEDGNRRISRSRVGRESMLQVLSEVCGTMCREADAISGQTSAQPQHSESKTTQPMTQQLPDGIPQARFY